MTRFSGSITALVTPFRDGLVDFSALGGLIERQIAAGTHGLVPVGTTGESPTLSMEEHIAVVGHCVEITAGRVPVIAGAGSNNTAEALHLAETAREVGADALLCATGYYNKPPQAGIFAHYKAVGEATDLPIIVYNVPARTHSNISVETLAALSRLPTIAGVKDATGDLARVADQRIACEDGFVQLSGEDVTALGFNAMGGRGCISVTSNVAPGECAALQNACSSGDWKRARELQDLLTPLHRALFADTSPAPVKYALSRLGLIENELRLPLLPAREEAQAAVDRALARLDQI